jgi:hypothetical protein
MWNMTERTACGACMLNDASSQLAISTLVKPNTPAGP